MTFDAPPAPHVGGTDRTTGDREHTIDGRGVGGMTLI